MIRGLLGIVAGFSCWAFLLWGLNALLPAVFRKMYHHDGTTENGLLNLLVVLLSVDFAFLGGLLCAKIAKIHERRFAFVLGLIQLGVTLYVYPTMGPRLPLGHFIAFLVCLLPAAFGGATYQTIDKGIPEEA